VLNESDIAKLTGLTQAEAAARLRQDGYNELPTSKPRSMLAITADVIREPMFLLLISVCVIYLLLGDAREALPLMVAVAVVIGITLYQEHKTERALEALRDLSSPRALVIRGGVQQRIAGHEVVHGDLLVLNEGDRVPADAQLLWSSHLSADESLLTGESVPVRKRVMEEKIPSMRPGGDDLPFVYASTLIVSGKGVAEVSAIGLGTEIGRIGKALQTLEPVVTPLQHETRRMVRIFAAAGLALCAVVVIVYGLTRGDWLNGFLAGLTLAMAILPEEFPVVLTVFLALGAWRIARSQVLTRRMPAIETLGSATVLCVDKTGTLTQNRMSVAQLYANGVYLDVAAPGASLPEHFHELIEYAILASQRDPFDPMEKALRGLGQQTLAATEHLHDNWSLVREYPLSPQLLALSHVWQARTDDHYVIAAKGAPEAIMDLCHLDAARTDELNHHVTHLTDQGLRVLGVARAVFQEARLPGDQHDFDFEFLGFVGLADPIRPAVPAALAACYSAGIRVIMITGDYPGTARNIAQQIGLTTRDEILTGPELDRLSDDELRHRIKRINIFARVVPEQKLRIVSALKANGEIVAMTGDGVNDAPALKSAHIGVAMGGRGTDVAREAADLVLLDDDFSSIVEAVKLGRHIRDNLTKAVAYIFAVHVPTAGISLLPVFFGWPLALLPIHIAFLELIIDPACSTVFEAEREEANVMQRPPRPVGARLFDRHTMLLGLLQGLGVLIVVFAIYALALQRGLGEAEARTLTFTALVAANLALILTNRSWSCSAIASFKSPNAALWWVTGGTLLFLLLALYLPSGRTLFHFAALDTHDLALSFAAGIAGVLWFELFKYFARTTKMES
jgi:Ca2+-transporting ATPase